jgi:TRAP-type C4-dicarboxylate transport system permease small subunit
MNALKKIDLFLNKIEQAVLVTMLSIMVVAAFAQVLLRNIFSAGIPWADILLRHLVLWVGFLGAALATSERRHINIDALRRFLNPRVRSAVDAVTDLFAAGVCYFLAKAAWTLVAAEMGDKSTLFGDIPTWWAQMIIPVGFGLLVLHFVIRSLLRAQSAWINGGAE